MLKEFMGFLRRRPEYRKGQAEFSVAEVAQALPGSPPDHFERRFENNNNRAKLRPVFEALVDLGYLEALGSPNNRSNYYRFARGGYSLLQSRLRAGDRLKKKPKKPFLNKEAEEIKGEIKKLEKKLKKIESKA